MSWLRVRSYNAAAPLRAAARPAPAPVFEDVGWRIMNNLAVRDNLRVYMYCCRHTPWSGVARPHAHARVCLSPRQAV